MREQTEYRTTFNCKNCKTETWFNVPQGTLLVDFLAEAEEKCRECGCLLVEKEE